MKKKEALQALSLSLESVVAEACKIAPELHIPEATQLEANVGISC